ncbi:MAG: ATPase [Deltaproteobacteria bacterium HGW-Deltaproteobacteria-1]|jgi:Ca2+-transporting ATPase|nr:MAG: ATPase [Deltaproteobacteria bacterium HGW-Deltaproteobacteria-1]
MAFTEEQAKQIKGLSRTEVDEKLKTEGYNELPSSKKRNILAIAFEVVKEPMFLLLVACGSIYLFLGEPQDALMLLGFVFIMIGITIYQEGKTEKALDALRDLSSPRALVIRDGERIRIPGREVVTGDMVCLSEGDRIPADGVVVWARNLTVDESLLTGESIAVRKTATEDDPECMKMEKPGGEDIPCVYSGTLVVQGQGIACIKAAGIHTEIGNIGKALQTVVQEDTLLQKETARIVKAVFLIALVLFVLVVLVYGLIRGSWMDGVLSGITLAMAMLPEEFPVVLTIFLALGAWRISQKQVLTRKMAAVETLGAATVLCTDKTGTLTQNLMALRMLLAGDEFHTIREENPIPLPETFHELVEFGILASKKDPFDPMEKALLKLGVDKLSQTEHLHANWSLVHEYPLSQELLALSHVWTSPDGKDFVISAKGAPEAIIDLCHLDENRLKALAERIEHMAGQGLRVLGVAKAYFQHDNSLPAIQHDFNFQFIGLIGLEDPIRPTVPDAIRMCYSAGIKVVMITGDYPITAQTIAQQIGLKNPDNVITGKELEQMDALTLSRRIKEVNVFARVVPEQKLILVNALKAAGQIVAMTGDGVNDAPALKSAHIGIAMGERGTDVAREASDLVLLNDDFSSIVAAVRMGRKIFDNLKKAMAYIVSVHIPIAGMSLLPVFLGWKEMILLPVHIVFLELIIDPACSVVFEAEAEESGIMQRKPRDPGERLFGKRTLAISAAQGIVALIVVALVYKAAFSLGHATDEARAIAFVTLIISNLCLILTNRSWSRSIFASCKSPNPALTWVLGGALIFLGLVIFVPFLQGIFHFAPMHTIDFCLALIAGFVSITWFEILKIFMHKEHVDLLEDKT